MFHYSLPTILCTLLQFLGARTSPKRLRLRPELTKELNQDGFSPLHLASANGYIDIVRELLKIDNSLCRLEGRESRTPLHSAAIKGRGDVISELIRACGDCIEDVTVQGETALHLAVKNCQFESIKVLVEWMREMNKRFVLNMKDEKGNTVLHLATWRKQRQASYLYNILNLVLQLRSK